MEERGLQGDPRYGQLIAMANQTKAGSEGGLQEHGGGHGNMPPVSGAGDGPNMQHGIVLILISIHESVSIKSLA